MKEEGWGGGQERRGARGTRPEKGTRIFTSHELCNLASKTEISPPPLPLGGTTSNLADVAHAAARRFN